MIRKVLNTIASDGGDITLDKKVLTVATLPSVEFENISKSTGVLISLAETVEIKTVAYTAANNTTYEFTVSQIREGKLYTKTVKYISDASGTDAEIATGLVGAFNNAKNGIKATASGSVSPITFTADSKYDSDFVITGEPMLSITAVSNIDTVASNQDDHTTILRAGSITDATPCVVTVVGDDHGLVTGQKVTLAAITTATSLNATWRVTVLSSTTYSLDGSVEGTGSAGVGSATAIEVAQASRGHKGDLINDGISSGDISSDIAYSRFDLTYSLDKPSNSGYKGEVTGLRARLYISAHGSTSSSYSVTSNYADFGKRLTERLKGVVAEDFVKFVGYDKVLLAPTGTWAKTRVAQGNYTYRKTASAETPVVGMDITAALQTATAKGFKLNSMDIIYGITVKALSTAATMVLDRIEYVNSTAVDVNSIAITGTLETGFQATPYVTNVVIDSPIFDVTDDSRYVAEITFPAQDNTVLDFYGIMLKFTKTEVDYEINSLV